MTKREFKKAHDRNRARRLVSEAVKLVYSALPENLNLVIMPKAQVLMETPDKLSKEIKI
jgi:ribonuclease P protein component